MLPLSLARALQAAALLLIPVLAQAQTPAPAAPPAASGSDAEAAQALMRDRCTLCHDLAQATSARKTAGEWTETVDRMISYGATLSPDERALLLRVLPRDQGLAPAS